MKYDLKLTGILALSLLLILSCARAADEQNATDAEKLQSLSQPLFEAGIAYDKATDDQSGKLGKVFRTLLNTNLPVMMVLAQKDPASATSGEVFRWAVIHGRYESGPLLTNRLEAVECLARFHAADTNLGPICSYIGNRWEWRWYEPPLIHFMSAVAKQNPAPIIRAQAVFGLGNLYAVKAENLAGFERWKDASFYRDSIDTNYYAALAAVGRDTASKATAIKYFKQVIKDYGDVHRVPVSDTDKSPQPWLKIRAVGQLYELEHLMPGCTVPEIEAADVSGARFKLSDSRGKVTLLSFWASWCGPCMQSVPVERELVARLKGKPFELIGVNGDGTTNAARQAMQKEGITWRSFWNETNSITDRWNMHAWPTVYVIDPRGIIQFKDEGYGPGTSNRLNGSVDAVLHKSFGT